MPVPQGDLDGEYDKLDREGKINWWNSELLYYQRQWRNIFQAKANTNFPKAEIDEMKKLLDYYDGKIYEIQDYILGLQARRG